MQHLEVVHDSPLAPDRVHAFLSEHENLGSVLGARITRVRDGDTERNGVGSVRSIRVWPLPPFEETVTAVEPDALVEYRITRGSPLRDHRGRVRVVPRDGGSRVTWTIAFDTAVPLLGPVVRLALLQSLSRGLRAVDSRA